MSKYVIELDEDVKILQSISVTPNGNAYTNTQWQANLEELNSDYINEHFGSLQDEAYQRGHDDGYEAGCATAFKPVSDAEYQRGYDAGYKKCLSENDFDQPCVSCDDYKRGLDDAWEAARKIALMDTETSENVTGYFGLFRIMENLTPMQAIEKLKAYEDGKNKICVGDIVYFKGKPEIKACVTAINESGMETTFCGIAITNVETYCSVGNPYSFCRTDDWCKTGERFDIEQLWKGEDNA